MERTEIPGVGTAQFADRAVAVLEILVRDGEARIPEVTPGRVIAPATGL